MTEPAALKVDARLLWPKYMPIKDFPIKNSTPVATAPIHTSLHATRVLGSTVKINANNVRPPARRQSL
jgi:hypothetical protein